jgi:sterol 3beta-glucosyltransferase
VTRAFLEAAEGAGVDVAALDGDLTRVVSQQGVSAWAALRSYRSVLRPMMVAMLRSAAEAALAFRPDVIVHHPKVLSAPVAAARLGCPMCWWSSFRP